MTIYSSGRGQTPTTTSTEVSLYIYYNLRMLTNQVNYSQFRRCIITVDMCITLMQRHHLTNVLLITIFTPSQKSSYYYSIGVIAVTTNHERMSGLNFYRDMYLIYFSKIVGHSTSVILCFRMYSCFGYFVIILF